MKDAGSFTIAIGTMYATYALIGHQPSVELWWLYLIVGVVIYCIGNKAENAAYRRRKQAQDERAKKILEDHRDWEERWRK